MAFLTEHDKEYVTKQDICAHVGDDYAQYQGAIVPPIFQNTLFVRHSDTNGVPEGGYFYTRGNNPTVAIAERKVAALEGGDGALAFGSGMAAISAGIMHFLRKDCHVICIASCYSCTRLLLTQYFPERFGITCTLVNGTDLNEIRAAIRPETTLIYLESPSSTVYRVQDIGAIAQIAKEHNIGTVIDNTYATPLYQNPLKYGIDIVCHTASKYLGGHSDIVAGVLTARKEIIESIARFEHSLIGGIMDPHKAWLLIRGIRTLPVRMPQHAANAMKVAKFLEAHPKVKKVYYPALPSHPDHEMYKKYISGENGLMSFVPDCDGEGIKRFINSLKVFQFGCSWGGFESLATMIAVGMSEEDAAKVGIVPNIVRIHVGLEAADTLIADLEQALAKI